jgi:DNA-binding XRE family transcriptional regulator
MNFLSKNLKYLRKRFAVSQEQLGLQVEKRQTTIGNWENEVSEPNVKELIVITNYFGLSLDDLILSDLEKSNLITEEVISLFKRNGNLKGNRIGNPIGKKPTNYEPANTGLSTANEGQETLLFAVLNTLRQMDGKIDTVRAGVEELKKKKP